MITGHTSCDVHMLDMWLQAYDLTVLSGDVLFLLLETMVPYRMCVKHGCSAKQGSRIAL
jgi:hypothetical protein